MPVKITSRSLGTATSRSKLPPKNGKRPWWYRTNDKRFLGYGHRKGGPGVWIGRTPEWERKLGIADDYEPADGVRVFNFQQAVDEFQKLTRREEGTDIATKPVTLSEALDAYGDELTANGSDPYNAQRPKAHLPKNMLSMPLALINKPELERWRKVLIKRMKANTFNRTCVTLLAMVNLVAPHRTAIWKAGLKKLPNTKKARNIILSDDKVLAFVGAAYHLDAGLGLLCDVLAVTGARPSQPVRLLIEDLDLSDIRKPKLMMPCSGKGGGKRRAEKKDEHFAVPITSTLAMKLKVAAKGRAAHEPLLLRSTGKPWASKNGESWESKNINALYRRDIKRVVQSIGLDPNVVTVYALRHSSVVRMLLKKVPARIVAETHNTSIKMLETHYSRYILDHSDTLIRSALLHSEPVGNLVAAE